MESPKVNSNRSKKKSVRGVQINAPDLDKRFHKRAARKAASKADNKR